MSKVCRVLLAVHPRFRPDRSVAGSTEADVWTALKRLGHQTRILPLQDSFSSLAGEIEDFKPHIVFNLLEEFKGEAVFDFHVVSFLESMGIAYTGCNPRGLIVSRNKLWMSRLAEASGVAVPQTELYPLRGPARAMAREPLFVKFNREHASMGISQSNRVTKPGELRGVVAKLRTLLDAEILIQRFVAGIEVSVGVWGNLKPCALPPWQLHLGDERRVATERVKFSARYRQRRGIRATRFRGAVRERLQEESVRLFRLMDLSGYARFDYRVTSDGTPFLIDVNPNPNLSKSEDFASSARSEGLPYVEVVREILRLGFNYRPRR